jgi:hypothetical protein
MSLTVGAALVAAAVSAHATASDRAVLSRAAMERGLKKAQCTVAPNDAKIIGTEWLGRRLRIVEVTCRRRGNAVGSILFAVPVNRPSRGRLIRVQDWQLGHVVPGYRVTAPGYDRKTRTMNAIHKARAAGDCGTIKEWHWTGWSFRLIHVWSKPVCDGERFEWDSRHKWLAFPSRHPPGHSAAFAGAGTSLAK